MCEICGCSEESKATTTQAIPRSDHSIVIQVEQNLLAKNNQFAAVNREYFLKRKITAINLMSSPGSGKTTLLSRTISELKYQRDIAIIVGDQQTNLDAIKLKSSGADAIQVNTGKTCHLDAHMIGHSINDLSPTEHAILFIENVGNLVCPALFDLGESLRVILLSVAEGDNKPLKYPDIFRTAHLIILTKIDLLPYVEFDMDNCYEYINRINPTAKILSLSATTGSGLKNWYKWLKNLE